MEGVKRLLPWLGVLLVAVSVSLIVAAGRVRPPLDCVPGRLRWFEPSETCPDCHGTGVADRHFCTNHAGVIYYTQRGGVPVDTQGTWIPMTILPVGK